MDQQAPSFEQFKALLDGIRGDAQATLSADGARLYDVSGQFAEAAFQLFADGRCRNSNGAREASLSRAECVDPVNFSLSLVRSLQNWHRGAFEPLEMRLSPQTRRLAFAFYVATMAFHRYDVLAYVAEDDSALQRATAYARFAPQVLFEKKRYHVLSWSDARRGVPARCGVVGERLAVGGGASADVIAAAIGKIGRSRDSRLVLLS